MSEFDSFEKQLQGIAAHLPYPPTPPLSRPASVRMAQRHMRPIFVPPPILTRPLMRAAMLIFALGLCALAVPDIRAAVLAFLRIGSVTITLDGGARDGQPLNLNDISGETPLAAVQEAVNYRLRIPPDSTPDRVFVQEGEMVIMVWIDEDHQLEQALYQIPDGDWQIIKSADSVTITDVRGEYAVWVDVRHPVQIIRDGEVVDELTYFVDGSVLVWGIGRITYRLETGLMMDEARALAASLVPLE